MSKLHTFGRVTVHSGSGPKKFRVRYQDGLGKHRERTAPTEAKAIEIARSLDAALDDQDAPLQPGVRFKKVVSEWATDRSARGWSVKQHLSMMSVARTHVIPELGDRRCDQLTTDAINKLLARLAKDGYSASTVKAVRQCIRGACSWAVQQSVWKESRNPASNIVLPKAVKDTADEIGEPLDPSMVPSQSEVDALVKVAYQQRELFGLFVELAAASGLRFGELAALTKADWDPAGRLLTVNKTLVEAGKGDMTFIGVPKSRASRRRVLVPTKVAAKLDQRVKVLAADDLLFTSLRGRRLHHSNVMNREFHPAAAAAGFPKRFTFHALRHHAISNWVDAGMRVASVAKLAGHSSERFTFDRYYGARNDFLDELRQQGF